MNEHAEERSATNLKQHDSNIYGLEYIAEHYRMLQPTLSISPRNRPIQIPFRNHRHPTTILPSVISRQNREMLRRCQRGIFSVERGGIEYSGSDMARRMWGEGVVHERRTRCGIPAKDGLSEATAEYSLRAVSGTLLGLSGWEWVAVTKLSICSSFLSSLSLYLFFYPKFLDFVTLIYYLAYD